MLIVRRRGERGAAAIAQTVIVAPTILLALMSIVQFGLLFHARNIAENAAQAGAAAARSYDGSEASGRSQTAAYLSEAAGSTLSENTIDVTRGQAEVTVTVRGVVTSLIPGVHLHVTEAATGPVERYVPLPGGAGAS